MNGREDALYRRIRLGIRAKERLTRRTNAAVAYIDANPTATRKSDPQIKRLDDLMGQAHRLERAL